MNITIDQIQQLITFLEQFGPVTVTAVAAVIATVKQVMGVTDPAVAQADLQQLIQDAIAAKAQADQAAAWNDPQ